MCPMNVLPTASLPASTFEVLKIGFSYSFRFSTFPSTFIPLYSLFVFPLFLFPMPVCREGGWGGVEGGKEGQRDERGQASLFTCEHWTQACSHLQLAQQPWIIRSLKTTDAFSRSTKVRHQCCPKACSKSNLLIVEDNKGVEGVAALLVWIVAGKMKERRRNQIQSHGNESTCYVRYTRTPSFLNHHAHRTAMECPPNLSGT